MDFGKSLSFVLDDEKWVNKMLIGGLISLVPVLNWAAIGYSVRTLKNVAAGESRPLPDWDDLGGDLVKGLLVTVAGLVYALPLVIVGVLGLILFLTNSAAAVTSSYGYGPVEATNTVLGLGTVGIVCLLVPYFLLVAAWLPAATANYALAGDFGAFFRFAEIWGLISRNLGNYILLLLVYLVVSQVAGWVGSLVLIVGAAFTGFYASLVYGHLLGQFAAEAGRGQGPAPVPAV